MITNNSTGFQVGDTFEWKQGDGKGAWTRWNGDMYTNPEDGVPYLVFSDGRQCSKYDVNAWLEYKGNKIDIPKNKMRPTEQPKVNEQVNTISNQTAETPKQIITPAINNNVVIEAPAVTISPLESLLESSLKKSINLNVSVNVEIPPAELLKVLSESYSDGYQQIIEYLSANLIKEKIGEQVAKEIWLQMVETKKPEKPMVRKTPIEKTIKKSSSTKKILTNE